MPHKRAKASIRKANSLRMGFDLPPSQRLHHNEKRKNKKHSTTGSNETNNHKNMFRVLNAEKIRAAYKIRKNQTLDSSAQPSAVSPGQSKSSRSPSSANKQKTKKNSLSKLADELKILPGEGMGSFNRRVEETLRPKVTEVMRAARKNQSGPNPVDITGKGSSSGTVDERGSKTKKQEELNSSEVKKPMQIKDFAPRPSKFPITDTVMEPPTLRLTKSMKKVASSSSNTSQAPLPVSSSQKRIMELERDRAIKRYRQMKEERNAQD